MAIWTIGWNTDSLIYVGKMDWLLSYFDCTITSNRLSDIRGVTVKCNIFRRVSMLNSDSSEDRTEVDALSAICLKYAENLWK